MTLNPGDWLVIFTDGVVDAVNTCGEEFGETRLLPAAAASGQATTAQVMQRIMTSIDSLRRQHAQHDDMTCLLVKVV